MQSADNGCHFGAQSETTVLHFNTSKQLINQYDCKSQTALMISFIHQSIDKCTLSYVDGCVSSDSYTFVQWKI